MTDIVYSDDFNLRHDNAIVDVDFPTFYSAWASTPQGKRMLNDRSYMSLKLEGARPSFEQGLDQGKVEIHRISASYKNDSFARRPHADRERRMQDFEIGTGNTGQLVLLAEAINEGKINPYDVGTFKIVVPRGQEPEFCQDFSTRNHPNLKLPVPQLTKG